MAEPWRMAPLPITMLPWLAYRVCRRIEPSVVPRVDPSCTLTLPFVAVSPIEPPTVVTPATLMLPDDAMANVPAPLDDSSVTAPLLKMYTDPPPATVRSPVAVLSNAFFCPMSPLAVTREIAGADSEPPAVVTLPCPSSSMPSAPCDATLPAIVRLPGELPVVVDKSIAAAD